MSRDPSPGDDTIRGAADEIRRETRAAVPRSDRAWCRQTRDARSPPGGHGRDRLGAPRGLGAIARCRAGAAARLSRAERKELTRELLLDAAIEVFAQKGYHGASLDDVAEAAGFTKGAVYSNFTRKSDLFRELLERETRRRNAALGAGMASVSVEALPEVGGEWLRRQAGEQRDWDLLTVEFWLAAVRDPALGARLSHGREQALDDFGGILDQKLAEAGIDAGLSGRELAEVFDALGTGLLMSQYLDPAGDRADLFARAARKMLAAVRTPPGPRAGRVLTARTREETRCASSSRGAVARPAAGWSSACDRQGMTSSTWTSGTMAAPTGSAWSPTWPTRGRPSRHWPERTRSCTWPPSRPLSSGRRPRRSHQNAVT